MLKHFFPAWGLFLLPDGGAGAGAAGAAGDAGQGAGASEGNAAVASREDPRIAAAREREAKRNPLKNVVYGRQAQAAVPDTQKQAETQNELTDEQQWEEQKKRYSSFYGRDVQAAVQDRFKNQADANAQMKSLEPMLQALYQKYGVNDTDALKAKVLDDDSLYEDLAIEMGTTVQVAKQYKQMQQQVEAAEAEKQASMQQQFIRDHLIKLANQGEAMKQTFPDFDLQKELANPIFRRLTSPEVGISVADAYYTVHRQELEPRAMAYGIQTAQQQMSQKIQSQGRRPVEGALKQTAAVEVRTDPSKFTKADFEEVKKRAARARLSGGPRPSF